MKKKLDFTISKIEKKFNKKLTSKIFISKDSIDYLASLKISNPIIISDQNIINNNKEYFDILTSIFPKFYIFDEVTADDTHHNQLLNITKNYNFIIAFGSGSINDLCKYTAFKQNIPYLIIASSYSMNGYLSSTASLKIQGLKKTLAAKSPTYAVFDIDILANSPKRLTKSGIFDVTCSYLIENDWLLSHYLKMDDNLYDKFYFDVQRPFLENLQNNLTENFNHINNDDLLSLLIITGILMNFCQNSNPASQAEHLIAHLLEMQKSFKKELYHGEQVLIGCLLSYNLQKYIMQNFNNIILTLKTDIKFTKIFPKNYSQICQKLYKIKLDKIEVNKNFNSFTSPFKDNSMIFNENLKKTAKIFQFLSIENISLNPLYYLKSQKDLEFALRNAALIRDRFTHLDLLVNSNINLNDLTTEANH